MATLLSKKKAAAAKSAPATMPTEFKPDTIIRSADEFKVLYRSAQAQGMGMSANILPLLTAGELNDGDETEFTPTGEIRSANTQTGPTFRVNGEIATASGSAKTRMNLKSGWNMDLGASQPLSDDQIEAVFDAVETGTPLPVFIRKIEIDETNVIAVATVMI